MTSFYTAIGSTSSIWTMCWLCSAMLNDTQLPILLTYPSFFQQRLVDFQILALIDVKYNFFQAPGTLHKRFYCLHSNGGGFFRWEIKFPSRDTAKSQAAQALFISQRQTGLVALSICQPAADNGADSVEHPIRGKVITRGDFSCSGGLWRLLPNHKLVAGLAQLDAGVGVDDVIDTSVAGYKAA